MGKYLITLWKEFEIEEVENKEEAYHRAAELFSDEWSQSCSLDDVLNVEIKEIS